MGVPYAEVIGDPIDHSLSPLIHNFWLEKLGIEGEYRATRIRPTELSDYLEGRRTDIWWRGCNVTAPLKEVAADLVGSPAGLCRFVGAVNCIVRTPMACLYGTNTDMLGVAEALRNTKLDGAIVCLIGSGGAARSVLCHFQGKPVARVRILARNVEKAAKLVEGFDGVFEVIGMDDARAAFGNASIIVNATPLGMTGKPPMVADVINGLAGADPDATIFDTLYAPPETELLSKARNIGLHTVNGLPMLIGQAAPAFELFFGAPAPREHDAELRERLTR
ncbi:shikimate dehydrogenase family protein [Sphingosinicella humi]|uniref:Shikimate dehydrogenase (NADP(+)) n=1 Tax=Allosphingosinicella humi TaxID=2068657 RepID=A0A2U2J2E9_9SPHN|nr:shikimate dehydrogenase [Sphingosinicella humi]PWG02506.1 shikimate dehydrogenase [Sphingosinicella humi]